MSIQSFGDTSVSMQSWPSLAASGKELLLKGGKLFFYDAGDSAAGTVDSMAQKPALILIHGLGDEADTWRHILPLLCQKGYRVLAPDLPGFGRSQWQGRISVKGHVEAIVHLMIETGAASPEHPAVLAGSSMGAVIAEAAAFKRPDLVKALILIDGCFPLSGSLDRSLFIMGLPFIGRNWYRSFRKNHEGAWKSLYPYYHDLDSLNEADKHFLRKRVIARVESAGQERAYFASLRCINWLFLFDRKSFSSRVKRFPGKILLLWGAADRILPAVRAACFRSLRPDTVFETLPGAGHLPQQENPAAVAEAMITFLKRRLMP